MLRHNDVNTSSHFRTAPQNTPALQTPIRRLPFAVGDTAELPVVVVDPETLGVRRVVQRYTRLTERSWRYVNTESGFEVVLDVDEHGVVLDYPGEFRRAS